MARRKDTKLPDTPDQIPLTRIEAERIIEMRGLSVADLVAASPVELIELLKWNRDPRLWRYRIVS